ncbi:CBF/Mak21 family-domain-containing protein [Cytidiella melzeri]|nr:CBF/Mak21 family-domain-containing protein [Cytidiella melzeri]
MPPKVQSLSQVAVKQDKSQKRRKDGRPHKKDDLAKQIAEAGGVQSDIELVKGSQDEQLISGVVDEDPKLKGDVSKLLAGLKYSKEDKLRKKKPEKSPASLDTPKTKTPKRSKITEKTDELPNDVAELKPAVIGVSPSKGHGKLKFEPNVHWYSATAPLPPPPKPLAAPSAAQVATLSERASTLFDADTATYQASSMFTGKSASDTHFLNTILSKGTLSDRLSALTLLVQASPVHNTKALESLKSMAERGRGKGGRDEGLKAMRCVVDWWVGGGAPGRKLRYFRDQPLLHPSVTDQHLISWYFEDWLKKYFFAVLQILETYSLDPLPYVRTQALSFITTLLREKPEQEQNLLRLLVNKLGDQEKSVCSRASYHLLQVLQAHPAMKSVIVRETKTLIFKRAPSAPAPSQGLEFKHNSHVRFSDDAGKTKGKGKGKSPGEVAKGDVMERWNSHVWYYASVTLNQVVLSASDHDREVARALIDLYFEMFREILGGSATWKTGEDDRDEPRTKSEHDQNSSRRKGKSKEVQGDGGFTEVEDANSRLVSAVLAGVNRALPFAKVDMAGGSDLFKKHVDTLFLITHTSTFNISLQALMLILQIVTNPPTKAPSTSKDGTASFFETLTDRFYRTLYASLSDQRLSTSNKQAMYLNLVFKALKTDQNIERVKAFIRRFIQTLVFGVGGSAGVEFITGGLYLLGELFGTVPGLRTMFNVPAASTGADTEVYDPRKRDPQYAHASASPLYELIPLLHHYHPAVSLHARQLLSSQPVTATPDLSLNTLSHFLDRFVYKNPKQPKAKGASAMQPAASSIDGASGVKLVKGEVASGEGPVNDERFWRRRVEDVPVDELFFHKYFIQKNAKAKDMAQKVQKRKAKDEEGESDNEDSEDAEAEEDEDVVEEESENDDEEGEIWKAMKATLPAELQDDDGLSMDSDDLSSDPDDNGHVEEADDDDDVDDGSNDEAGKGDDDDALSLVEESDNDDLLPLDAEIPNGLIDFEGHASDEEPEEEWGGIGGTSQKKRKRAGDESEKKRSKKLRSLPTFASYEDYAKMIEDGPEDNI